MIFGDKHRFAIELELDSETPNIWMDGWACYWIGGARIGYERQHTYLSDALAEWEGVSSEQDRSNDELFPMETDILFHTLCCGLIGNGCEDADRYIEWGIEGQWRRHDIGRYVLMGWIIFLVEGGSEARCVYGSADEDSSEVREQRLQLGEFNRVLDEAIVYLLKIYLPIVGVDRRFRRYWMLQTDERFLCRVCAYPQKTFPWGENGDEPSDDRCPCCGVTFGYQDDTLENIREYRGGWIAAGAPWFDENERPSDWNLEDQLKQLPPKFS